MTTVELYYSDTCLTCHQVRALLMETLPKTVKFKEINTSYPEGKQKASELNIMSVQQWLLIRMLFLLEEFQKMNS
ncbi:MAG: hypothetical protein MPEBLZ_01421 [Candidatus Methanoperedens nitroreducens]|uniref:Glutaredoxin n=1 Tax=Candidatus Methanoperedens nitratireducens TaxID=1392998 RepID=A0A0P8A7E5_9EURY|nr:MAG: hypothetical protein MPEBLZ_01421 [Candidatus Methanoperedens sp. BLZ1]